MNRYLAEDIKEYIVLYEEYLKRSMCENLIKNLKMSKIGFDSFVRPGRGFEVDKTKYVIPEDLQYLYDNYDVDCIYHECLFDGHTPCHASSCYRTHGILIRELIPFLEESFYEGFSGDIRIEYIKYVISENVEFDMSKMILEDYFLLFLDENPLGVVPYNEFSLVINLNINSEYYSHIFLVDWQWSYEDDEYSDDEDSLVAEEVVPTPIKLTFIAHNFTELAEKMVDKKDGLLARMFHRFTPLIN